ncbi:MAG: hypothetical protein ACOX7J_08225 [Bacillota bacterium]|jgi:hypothetical protein
MKGNYDDIINLPHHVSPTRPRMSMIDRAAQFSPFSALTGHDSAVKETARLTDQRIELSEDMKNEINDRLLFIAERKEENPEIEITYFKPDEKKEGGAYITAFGSVKKINEYERVIIMNDGPKIQIDDIISIDGQIFEKIYEE